MLDYKRNSFNLIRLLAALQVFFGHAFVHLNVDYELKVLGMLQGVPIFFFLSGFLIWGSIERCSDLKMYIKKRVLRIYPELWLGVALSLISILVLYFESINWAEFGLFAIGQSTFLQFWTPDFLRGFGCGTPNGSLWTIGVIVQFYFSAWFLFEILKRKKIMFFAILLSAVINLVMPNMKGILLPSVLYKLFNQTVIPYLWMFLLGAWCWNCKERVVPIAKRIWWIAVLLLLLAKYIDLPIYGLYDMPRSLCLFILIIGIAYSFPGINLKHDISYGIYIYHMIVINVLIELNIMQSWYSVILALLITCILASSSYFLNSQINKIWRCRK